MEGGAKKSRRLEHFNLKELPILEDEFKVTMVLGSGGFAQVSQAKAMRNENLIVAVKCFKQDVAYWEHSAKVEIEMLRNLAGCPNILNLIRLMRDKENAICAVIEYVDYNLQQIFEQGKEKGLQVRGNFFPLDTIKGYLKQILLGVDFMHERGIMHRDLWPQNILLTARNQIKIADFGMAERFTDPAKTKFSNPVTYLWYRAPEILLGDQQYDCAIDMWSVGCLFGYMLVVQHLFAAPCKRDESDDEEGQMRLIWDICGTPVASEWHPRFHDRIHQIPPPAKSRTLIQKLLLKKLYERRMKPQVTRLLDAMLALSPEKRINAKDALLHPCLVSENPTPSKPEEMPALENMEIKRQRRK